MSWNYRVMAKEYEGEIYFDIHEVYYDKKGKPDGCTANPVSVGGYNKKGIKWTLKMMKKATKKPILWYGDKFPKKYKK